MKTKIKRKYAKIVAINTLRNNNKAQKGRTFIPNHCTQAGTAKMKSTNISRRTVCSLKTVTQLTVTENHFKFTTNNVVVYKS
jgi:hypothetical protein